MIAKTKTIFDRNTSIEDLLAVLPQAVQYLRDKGIRCFVCGEPIWGTIQSACIEKGFTEREIDVVIKELNELK